MRGTRCKKKFPWLCEHWGKYFCLYWDLLVLSDWIRNKNGRYIWGAGATCFLQKCKSNQNKFCKSGTRYFSRFNRDKVFSFYKIYPYLNKIESVDVESIKRIWFSIGVWY